MRDYFSVPPGGQVLSFQPRGFSQVYGIWVDNFSGGWLGIDGLDLWVPPYTRGWKAEVMPGSSSITVRSYDFANGVTIAGATGQAAKVTLWDEPAGNSEGIDFFDAQTIPVTVITSIAPPVIGGVLLPAPAVGRIRIYEIGLGYGGVANNSPAGVRLTGYYAGGFLSIGNISPASPIDRAVLRQPGGDLPITTALNYNLIVLDPPDVQSNVTMYVRYAVI